MSSYVMFVCLSQGITNISLMCLFIKGKRSFGNFFFSSPRQGNMERKSKLKKKLKFLYFRPRKRLFGSEERELNGGERSVF